MAEKTTHGNTFPELTPEGLVLRITERARAHGADPVALLEGQALHLEGMGTTMVRALEGDERLAAHLNAQFKLGAFSAAAEAYLEAVAWRKGIVDVLTQIVVAAGEAAIAAVAKGMIASLQEGMEAQVTQHKDLTFATGVCRKCKATWDLDRVYTQPEVPVLLKAEGTCPDCLSKQVSFPYTKPAKGKKKQATKPPTPKTEKLKRPDAEPVDETGSWKRSAISGDMVPPE